MSLGYIRNYYRVPAKRGVNVRFTNSNGARFVGEIIGASGAHLKVSVTDKNNPDYSFKERLILHPTWNLEYLEANT